MTAQAVLQTVVAGQRGDIMNCSPQGPTIVTIPAPPSVNNLFITAKSGRRVKSKHYHFWQTEAGWRLKAQHPSKVGGKVVILIAVERSSDLADIDNRIKPILDLLVTHKVIDDDSNVVAVAAAWSPPGNDDARVLITPAADLSIFFQMSADQKHGGFFLETEPQGAPDGD